MSGPSVEATAAAVRRPALIAALLLGVLANVLLRVEGTLGVNALLFAVGGVLALAELDGRRKERSSPEATALMAAALLIMTGLALRDSGPVKALDIAAAAALVSLAAFASSASWVRRAGASRYLQAAANMAANLAVGPLGLLTLGRDHARAPSKESPVRIVTAVLKGSALALIPLVVFGALLASADPVFRALLGDWFRFDPEPLIERVIVIGFFAWISAGFFRGFLVGPMLGREPVPRLVPRIGVLEASVALGLLNALFLAFVAVQVSTLFGGERMVALTPGLTYAEYARQGFFQLLWVGALVIPLLLVADWAVNGGPDPGDRGDDDDNGRPGNPSRAPGAWLRALMVLLVALLLLINGSAFRRLGLYLSAYGLTEARLLAGVFMTWLTVVLAWLAATVLRGRRSRFAFGALATGLLVIAGLNLVNVQAAMVRTNLAMVADGRPFDAEYATGLSADAVPALMEGLTALPSAQRCQVTETLSERWGGARRGGWRTWSWSDARARAMVRTLPARALDCP